MRHGALYHSMCGVRRISALPAQCTYLISRCLVAQGEREELSRFVVRDIVRHVLMCVTLWYSSFQ